MVAPTQRDAGKKTAAAVAFVGLLGGSLAWIDSASGASTTVSPGQSLSSAMNALGAGDTLIVKGGTYSGTVSASLPSGAVVKAAPGERVVLKGLLRVTGSGWTMDGINVEWPSSGASSSDHMAKFSGGSGWTFKNAEVSGARSYAGILVAKDASKWTLRNLYVHDTHKSNSTNQDHLIYVNTSGSGGLIERSLFVNSPNGRGIKIGPPSGGSSAVGGVTIRFNTFYNNLGPSNIQLSYGASNNRIENNLLVKSGSANVTAFNLNGTNNMASNNVGFQSSSVVESGIASSGNVQADPQFDSVTQGMAGFNPRNPAASNAGFRAGGGTPAPSNTSSPAPTPTGSSVPGPTATSVPTLPPGPSRTFTATVDAAVKSNAPDRAYGDEEWLRVRAGDPEYRSYLKFNVQGLTAPVKSARLRLTATDESRSGGTVFRTAIGWSESSITWETRPALGTNLARMGGVGSSTVDIVLPVTSVPSNGTYAFAVTAGSSDSAIFASREAGGAAPQLILTSS